MMGDFIINIILFQPHFMALPGFPEYAPPFLAADIFDMLGGLGDYPFGRPEEKLKKTCASVLCDGLCAAFVFFSFRCFEQYFGG